MSSTTFKRAIAPAALAATGLALMFAPVVSRASQGTTKVGPPSVNTGPARAAGSNVALTGTINAHGLPTTYYFEYGPANPRGGAPDSYPSRAPAGEPRKVTEQSVLDRTSERVSEAVLATDLPAGDHYRLVATNEMGTKVGKDQVYSPKPTKTLFQLPSSFQPTLYGEPFVLSGSLTGSERAGREVVLDGTPYPYTATPIPEATAVTSASGSFSFQIPHLTTNTRFHVATASGPPLSSDSFIQLAAVRVTLKAQSGHHVKGLVRLFGTVSPVAVGARVFLQLEQPPKPKPPKSEKLEKERATRSEEQEKPPAFATKFLTVVKRATRHVSRFSVVVTVRTTGNYRAFVQLPLGPIASGQSETVLLHAAPKKHKK